MLQTEIVEEGHFNFDPQDPIYADHFPGQAVVPGSLIIEAFIIAARSIAKGHRTSSIENFRFKRFITPGFYAFRIRRKAGGCLQCTLFDSDRPVVTGILRERV